MFKRTAIENNISGRGLSRLFKSLMGRFTSKSHEVFRAVIVPRLIDMVNRFPRKQISSDQFFDDKAMLLDTPFFIMERMPRAHDLDVSAMMANPAFPLAAVYSSHVLLGCLRSFFTKINFRYFISRFFRNNMSLTSQSNTATPLLGKYPPLKSLAQMFSMLCRSWFFLKPMKNLANMFPMFSRKCFTGLGRPHAQYRFFGMTVAFSHVPIISYLKYRCQLKEFNWGMTC